MRSLSRAAYWHILFIGMDKIKEGGATMPAWIQWLTEHWLSVMLAAGAAVAVIYVILHRKLLFYKE